MLHEIRVVDEEPAPLGRSVLADIHRLNLGPFCEVRTIKVYRVEGLSHEEVRVFACAILDIGQSYTLDERVDLGAAHVVEVGYKPGVMNPESASLLKVARDLGLEHVLAADSSVEYHFFGEADSSHVDVVLERLLVNKTVQHVIRDAPPTLIIEGGAGSVVQTVSIRTMDDASLMALSKDALFLNLEEMRAVRTFFGKEGRDAKDAELELLGVFWSEHCCHKTFKAPIETPDGVKPPFMQRLKETASRFALGTVSALVDNPGVAPF